ncbi:MAG: divergent polysaccharide deacetylase family protein [Deltaproteobacteria bacterium]|nr:divergent polysaccharide deacetylase family protein [Deltaproteobacteria bacterium]
MPKKGGKQGGRVWITALLVFSFILGAAAVIFFGGYVGEKGGKERPKPGEPAALNKPLSSVPPLRLRPPMPSAMAAIVIDDMGADMEKLRSILDVNAQITVAVMPYLRHSRDVAEEAHLRGLEVLLHLPMEPKDSRKNDPGTGALLNAMSNEEIQRRLKSDISGVPYATGVNNHMGSEFTENASGMRAVMEVLKEKKFFFLDSRTSPRSVAARLAVESGVKTASRNVFLDNERDKRSIRGQFAELLRMARKNGKAIAIGHPYPETLEVLKEVMAEFKKEGVEVVRVSELTR